MGLDFQTHSTEPNQENALPDDISLGERIRIFRKLRGLRQSDLARRVKRSVRWMVNVESDTAQARLADLLDLARALEVSFQELTGANPPIAALEPDAASSHPRELAAPTDRLQPSQVADLTAVYSTRAAFMTNLPPDRLFADATSIRTTGISLNLISQQYADQRLVALLESGASIQCLFLDPQGSHIQEREHEEGYPAGHLSSLTQLNIDILKRLRNRVAGDANERFEIAVYDEVPRFNIVLIDHRRCVIQPYMPAMRGIDSPTFVVEDSEQQGAEGVFSTFARVYSWLWERRREC